MLDLRLDDKMYLVTGASSGIGRAAAVAISNLGGRIVLSGRDEKRLRETLSMLQGEGHLIEPFDFGDLTDVKAWLGRCIKKAGRRFDGLVHSAGIDTLKVLRSANMSEYGRCMKINADSLFALLVEFSTKRILNNGGSIVAVSSSAVCHMNRGKGIYVASKAAVEAVCGVAANELSRRHIRVNTVRPEAVNTPLGVDFFQRCSAELRDQFYPLGALEAEEVADAIVFLLSDMSKKITGQNIYLSAGNDGRPVEGYHINFN